MQDVHNGEEKHHVKLSRHTIKNENIPRSGPLSSAPENVSTSANASSRGSSTLSVAEQAASLKRGDAEEPHTRDVEIGSDSKASSGLPFPSSGAHKHPIYRTASGIQVGPAPVPYPPIEYTPSNRSSSKNKGKERVPEQDDEASSPYPEGGLKAWSVVFGSFSGMTASFGVLNSVGTFQAYLSTHQLAHESPSSIGWIFSLLAFLTFFCGVQIGPVFDAKGPRWLVAAGSVLLFAGMMGVAESTSKLASTSEVIHLSILTVLQNYGTLSSPILSSVGSPALLYSLQPLDLSPTSSPEGAAKQPALLQLVGQ